MSKVAWFEIPVRDMDRAAQFYETVFDISIKKVDMGDLQMGWFPEDSEKPGANGSLMYHSEFYFPDENKGALIYFTSEDLALELGRVQGAGGKVLVDKRQISPDNGYMGVFVDSEGNRIALHSKK